MDSHQIDSMLRRAGSVAVRAGINRVPGARSIFRWLHNYNAARPAPIDHHGFELFLTPRMTSRLVGNNGVKYEQQVDATLRGLVSEGDVVLDIGGFIGYHTLALRRAVGTSGHVIVFEPLPDNADLIERTIHANGFENVTLERMAVSASSDTMALSVPKKDRSMSSTATVYEDAREIIIDTVTLPEYLNAAGVDRVDLAKLDVEGGEHAILCETDALNHIEVLVCEIHPHALEVDEMEAIIERLSSMGTVTGLDDDPFGLDYERIDEPTHVVWIPDRDPD